MRNKRYDDIPFGGKFTFSVNLPNIHNNLRLNPGYKINKVIYNNRATIVFWDDGTKTVSKCSDNDIYSKSSGLAMAVLKKFVRSVEIKQLFEDWLPNAEGNSVVTLTDVRNKHKLNWNWSTVKISNSVDKMTTPLFQMKDDTTSDVAEDSVDEETEEAKG